MPPRRSKLKSIRDPASREAGSEFISRDIPLHSISKAYAGCSALTSINSAPYRGRVSADPWRIRLWFVASPQLQPPGRPGCEAASVIRSSPADRISKTPAVRIRDKDKPAMTAACGSDDSGCAGGPSRRDRPPRLAALSRQIRRDTVPGAVKFAAHETGGP